MCFVFVFKVKIYLVDIYASKVRESQEFLYCVV